MLIIDAAGRAHRKCFHYILRLSNTAVKNPDQSVEVHRQYMHMDRIIDHVWVQTYDYWHHCMHAL